MSHTVRRRCPRCRREVIEGLTTSGLDVTLDDYPLDAALELDALAAGLSTYTHHHGPDVLAYRDPWAIKGTPAGTRPRTSVLPAHDCPERTTTP